jgi:NMD protein affecting ribosome stability and mRNA decay
MKQPRKPTDYAQQHGKDERMYGERYEDPYQARGKYPEPSVCTGCGALFHKGRWQWGIAPAGAHKHLCPACQRIHDRQPAGILTIRGDFFAAHRQEILGLIHNAEAKERVEHPLQRVMKIEEGEDGVVVSLTDVHLTRTIGDDLHSAYEGELDYEYVERATVFRANWTR